MVRYVVNSLCVRCCICALLLYRVGMILPMANRLPNQPRQVRNKPKDGPEKNQGKEYHWSQDCDEREDVCGLFEAGVVLQRLGREPDLHCGENQDEPDRGRGDPVQVVAEEAAVVVPAVEVGLERREAEDAVDGVDAGEAQLSVMEPGVHLGRIVVPEDGSGQRLPGFPRHGSLAGALW